MRLVPVAARFVLAGAACVLAGGALLVVAALTGARREGVIALALSPFVCLLWTAMTWPSLRRAIDGAVAQTTATIVRPGPAFYLRLAVGAGVSAGIVVAFGEYPGGGPILGIGLGWIAQGWRCARWERRHGRRLLSAAGGVWAKGQSLVVTGPDV